MGDHYDMWLMPVAAFSDWDPVTQVKQLFRDELDHDLRKHFENGSATRELIFQTQMLRNSKNVAYGIGDIHTFVRHRLG